MKLHGRILAASLMGALAMASPVLAQGQTAPAARTGANLDSAATQAPASAEPAQQLTMAHELLRLGTEARDPLMVIAAARIYARIQTTEQQRTPTAGAETGTPPSTPTPGLQTAIDTARQLAEGNAQLLALVDGIAPAAARGRTRGPGVARAWVSPGRVVSYTETFRGGEWASIAIAGDGMSLLNLVVFDENGNRICMARRYGDRQSCGWTPNWTGPFRVEVHNVGGNATNFVLETN